MSSPIPGLEVEERPWRAVSDPLTFNQQKTVNPNFATGASPEAAAWQQTRAQQLRNPAPVTPAPTAPTPEVGAKPNILRRMGSAIGGAGNKAVAFGEGAATLGKRVADPLAAGGLGLYNVYEGAKEGDAAKVGLGALDTAAAVGLATPAAPIAGAYLGLRGLYDGAKYLADKAGDAVGGTINQIGLNTGLWGVDDSAYLQQKAATALRDATPTPPTPQPAAAATGPAKPSLADAGIPVSASNVTKTVGPDGSVSYSGGANISGPITINGQGLRNGGAISAQNLAAGDALGARQAQESLGRVQAAT